MGFDAYQAMPGVYHIRDAMGVCMTLLAGSERALLVDTGYGLEDVAAFVRTLSNLPLTVLLTHHHHDHALGARWFDGVLLHRADMEGYLFYTDEAHRQHVLRQAQAKGLSAPQDFLTSPCPAPTALDPQQTGEIALGGLSARLIPCPGHTPGSLCVYVPERKLLLSGDTWNPCTWLFFPEALPVTAHRRNARALLALPFEHVLCSHQHQLYPRTALEHALSALTDDALDAAARVTIAPYEHTDTRQVQLGEGQVLVFDWAKYEQSGKERS